MRLIRELARRKVLKVGAVYLGMAWVLLQLADILAPALALPDWTLRLVLLLLALGLPLALLLAWQFNLTPGGLAPEVHAPEGPSAPASARKRDWALLAAIAVLGLGAGMAAQQLMAPGAAPPEVGAAGSPQPSIAVLPFVSMSQAQEDGHFADGLSEEILNSLANVPGLKVAGRTSSFSYRGEERDLRQIARELGVAHVIEGSVRRQGDTLRVTAQLIEAEGGFHLWSQTFDRTLDDALAIQSEIATTVAQKLRLSILPPPAAAATLDAASQQAYLEALGLIGEGGDDSMQRAVALLRPVVERHPEFIPAYLPLADTVQRLGWYGRIRWQDAVEEMAALSREASTRAPDHIDARVLAALVPFARNDLRPTHAGYEAVLAAHQALAEEAPNHALLQLNTADAARILDRGELALRFAERYIALEPLDPKGYATLADIHHDMGDAPATIRVLERAIDIAPRHYPPYFDLARLHVRAGRYPQALDVVERCLRAGAYGCTGPLYDMYNVLRQDALMEAVARGSDHPLMRDYLTMLEARRREGYVGAARFVATRPGLEQQFADDLASAALESGEYQALLDLRARLTPDLVDPEARLLTWQADGANEVCIALHRLARADDARRCFVRVEEAARQGARALDRPAQLPRVAALAWLGQGDAAVALLREEIARGWRSERYLLETFSGQPDPLVEPLRGRADFAALMAQVRAGNARDFAALRDSGRTLVPPVPSRQAGGP